VVSEESKPRFEAAKPLFDLTSLQREANGRFGFSAKTTLSLAQSLYERHKALTYPRTDSKFLPEDYLNTVRETIAGLAEGKGLSKGIAPHAATITKNGWVKPNRRIFDNKKVSDHFAIIPTMQVPTELSDAEAKVYDIVVKRFLAIFFPPVEWRDTVRTTLVQGHHFKTEGKVMVSPGALERMATTSAVESATVLPSILVMRSPDCIPAASAAPPDVTSPTLAPSPV
jgi:DNA topoisomerase-3